MEHSEIMHTWAHALNVVAAEEGVSPLDIGALFDRLRTLDKTPFQVQFVISEFSGSLEAGRLVDFLRDIGNEFLNTAKTSVSDVKELNEMREARFYKPLETWHQDMMSALNTLRDSIARLSLGISGRLIGGKDGIFDVGTDLMLVRLKPGVQFPLNEVLLAPSEISMSFFAVEDDGGKFLIDVGVPKSAQITADTDENKHEDLLSLCTGEFWKQEFPPTTVETNGDVHAGCKHFPTHDRVVLLTVGSSALSLRADIANLSKHLATVQKDEDGLGDLFSLSFSSAPKSPEVTPELAPVSLTIVQSPTAETIAYVTSPTAETAALRSPAVMKESFSETALAPTSVSPFPSPSAKAQPTHPAESTPLYNLGLECLPGLFAQLTIRDFRMMGAPRRMSRFVKSTIHKQKLDQATLPPAPATSKVIGEMLKEIKGERAAEIKASIDNVTTIHTNNDTSSNKENDENNSKNDSEDEDKKDIDPVEVAVHSVMSEIGSESMLFRFTQSLDITVEEYGRIFVTLSRSNNKRTDARAFVFANTFLASDLFEKITVVQKALG